MATPAAQKALEDGYAHLVANKYNVLASTTMLVYDHILTFQQERMYIWKQRKSAPTFLFLLFRYVTPIVSLLNLVAEHDPRWTGKVCRNWIWLPVATGPIVSMATGVILIMRVHAIYARSQWTLYITIPVYLAELGVMAWAIPSGVPAQLPSGFVGCIPTEKAGTGRRLTALYIAALVFDAVVFTLTFGRALYLRATMQRSSLFRIIVRDGTLYFMVIFAVNLVNVFLLALAPPDISAINAPFATMITAVLVARLVLNLREAATRQTVLTASGPSGTVSIETWTTSDRPRSPDIAFNTRKPPNPIASFIGLHEFDAPLDDLEDGNTARTTVDTSEMNTNDSMAYELQQVQRG